ncbi:uncharacterized protein LOC102878699, partial [Pteropus alecto]|uniref:uncharacterized protein LOC102878699 n=1 Tax=Pteropus alecto TaxID=9402 RepID=UPI00076868C4
MLSQRPDTQEDPTKNRHGPESAEMYSYIDSAEDKEPLLGGAVITPATWESARTWRNCMLSAWTGTDRNPLVISMIALEEKKKKIWLKLGKEQQHQQHQQKAKLALGLLAPWTNWETEAWNDDEPCSVSRDKNTGRSSRYEEETRRAILCAETRFRLQKNLEGARRHCRIYGSHSLTDGTQDVKPQRQRSQDATGFLSLGVDEEWETLHEAKPVEMSLIREEGEEEKGTQPKPEQGAASGGEKEIRAEEEAEEGSDGGPDGPCAPGAMNDENHEASDDSGGEPGEQRQEEQPLQAIVQRQQPRDREQVVQRPMFTLVQVQELERIFRFNAYPNLFMRQEIARRMNMPEARVQ